MVKVFTDRSGRVWRRWQEENGGRRWAWRNGGWWWHDNSNPTLHLVMRLRQREDVDNGEAKTEDKGNTDNVKAQTQDK